MQIGVAYPTREVDANPASVRKFVKAAEELGYQHLMAYDHVIKTPHDNREPKLTGPYTEKDSFQDPFVFFGFAAGITETLEFATGVLCLPQRQTALVAQQAADVDLLSSERLRMFREAGGTHGCFHSMDKGLGNDIDAHIDYISQARHLWDNG